MKWVVAYIVSITVSVVSSVLLGFIFGSLNKAIASISLLIGLLAAIYIILKEKNLSLEIQKEELGFWSWSTITVFVLFSLKSFLWLIFKRGDSLFISSPHNLGDIVLHINNIQYFANGATFWPDSPIFINTKLHYPVGIDLFNSLLVLIGVDMIRSLIWVGLLSSIATCFALLAWGRAFTLAGFLFNGGTIGFILFQALILNDHQGELAWRSIPLTMFVPQRGLLYAIPAGLLLLCSFRSKFFNTDDGLSKESYIALPLWIEVLLYSTMPIFHMHTFVFFSSLLGIWIILLINKPGRLEIIKLIEFSILPALLFMGLLIDSNSGSIIHLKPGWMQANENFLKFWFLNFGFFWPLVIWLCFKLKTNYKKYAFVFPAIFLFIFFCIVMMAPWEWDNTKLLVWSYLILLPYLWKYLISNWKKEFKYVACFILFFSGFLHITQALNFTNGYELFKLSELRGVCSATEKLPIGNTFAASPAYNHPLLFCGRKVVIGYTGWIWSHGYKLNGIDKKLEKLMLGESNWHELAKELGVRYIFWGEREEREYKNSTKPWESQSLLIVSGPWGKIYEIGK